MRSNQRWKHSFTSSFVHSGKSALDVIYSNRDFAKLGARSDTTPKLEPTIDVVRMPETKYVLVMETSSSMSRYDWGVLISLIQNVKIG